LTVYFNKHSPQAALLAAGGTVQGASMHADTLVCSGGNAN
jgi:hypothetical protein